MRRRSLQFWQRACVTLFAGLFLFSGIANAYCSIDEAAQRPRVDAVNTQHAPDEGTAAKCPGFPDLVKEDIKHQPQWDAAPALHDATPRSQTPSLRAVAVLDRRAPLAEPVFRRFPKLLN